MSDKSTRMLRWYEDTPNVMWAAKQGAAAFELSMLTKLWTDHPCPYRTPVYREAWYRGLYSCACWCLMETLGRMHETHSPDPEKTLRNLKLPKGWVRHGKALKETQ